MAKIVNIRNPLGGSVNIQNDALGVVPIGTVIDFAGNTAPEGFLVCNGASHNVATYPDLYSAIGNIYGGSSPTFNVPNLVDTFIKGKGTDNVGDSGGSNTMEHTHGVTSNVSVGNHSALTLSNHTLTTANLPVHSHTINHDHASFNTVSGGSHSHSIPNGMHRSAGGAAPGGNIATTSATLTTNTDGSHTHAINVPNYSGSSGNTGSGSAISHSFSQNITAHSVTNNAVTSGAASNDDNRPKYITMLKCIKAY